MIRRGAANQDANYERDDRDPNGKLMGVSIQCKPNVAPPTSPAKEQQLIGDQVGFQRFMTANSTCVINKGGNVKTDRQLGNPNHCVINSVKIGDLKGCWR